MTFAGSDIPLTHVTRGGRIRRPAVWNPYKQTKAHQHGKQAERWLDQIEQEAESSTSKRVAQRGGGGIELLLVNRRTPGRQGDVSKLNALRPELLIPQGMATSPPIPPSDGRKTPRQLEALERPKCRTSGIAANSRGKALSSKPTRMTKGPYGRSAHGKSQRPETKHFTSPRSSRRAAP